MNHVAGKIERAYQRSDLLGACRKVKGLPVHAGSHEGELVIDETYWPVVLDGETLDEDLIRVLTVQRILAESDNVSIIAKACVGCGHSPTQGWLGPTTRHPCDACGAENRTRRRCFLNPLADRPQ